MDGPEAAPSDDGDVQSDLLESVGAVLSVINAVAGGDLSRRLEARYPESHPVGALTASINAMIDALWQAREASAAYLDQLNDKIAMVERQQEAIRSLSVPIIEVWTKVLCVPIVGVLDSARAADVTAALLTAVVDKRAQHAILDVTGIEVMDTQSADHFLRMARAVTLLGAECSLSGVRPHIARTIVHMGVDLQGLRCHRSMREALRYCVAQATSRKANRVQDGPSRR
jgi:rsbT co-antagonist protein RsbR